MVTATGVGLLNVGVMPDELSLFIPQQYAVPVVVRAQEELPLTAIALNETLGGMVTALGLLLEVVVPLPSWPKAFSPQQ